MFNPISQTRIAQRVVEQIVKSIREGRINPGDKLPGENSLAADFQVSRPCVREALRILEAVGVVEVRRGKGCYVLRSPDGLDGGSIWLSWLTVFRHEVLALMEVREAVESKAAALAALRASEADFAQLQEVTDRLWTGLRQGGDELTADEAYALDTKFHQAIASASGNPFLLRLANNIGGVIDADRRAIMSIPNRIQASAEDHRAILEALKKRDSEAARNAMMRHIQGVAKAIEAGVEDRADTNPRRTKRKRTMVG